MSNSIQNSPDLLGVVAQPPLHETLETGGHHAHVSVIWGRLDFGFLLLSFLAVWFAASAS